jgi:hypothetical protein
MSIKGFITRKTCKCGTDIGIARKARTQTFYIWPHSIGVSKVSKFGNVCPNSGADVSPEEILAILNDVIKARDGVEYVPWCHPLSKLKLWRDEMLELIGPAPAVPELGIRQTA